MATEDLFTEKRIRGRANLLGVCGLIPFAAAAFAAWLGINGMAPEAVELTLRWVLLYGAVILSFMGGARWGAAIRDQRMDKLLTAVIPALVGWAAVVPPALLPATWPVMAFAYGTLAVSFILLMITEFAAEDWPQWYMSLRLRLTMGVVILLAVTAAGRLI